jgi:hypothetical protein
MRSVRSRADDPGRRFAKPVTAYGSLNLFQALTESDAVAEDAIACASR